MFARTIYPLFTILAVLPLCVQAQERKEWKEFLAPPRPSIKLSFHFSMRDGYIVSEKEEETAIHLAYIDHRLKKDPGNLMLWRERIAALPDEHPELRNSMDKVMSIIEAKLSRQPNHRELEFLRISYLDRVDRNKECRKYGAAFLQKHPNDVPTRVILSGIDRADRNLEAARASAYSLINEFPEDARAWTNFAKFYLWRWNVTVTEMFPENKKNMYRQDIPALLEARLLQFESEPFYKNKLKAEYKELQMYIQHAVEAYSKAEDLAQGDQLIDSVGCELYILAAQAATKGERYEPYAKENYQINKYINLCSIVNLKAKARQFPDSPITQVCAVASCTFKVLLDESNRDKQELNVLLNRREEIIAFQQELRRKSPQCYSLLEQYSQSIEKFVEDNEYTPMSEYALYQLASFKLLLDFPDAERLIKRLLKLNPSHRDAFKLFLVIHSDPDNKINWEQIPEAVRLAQDNCWGRAMMAYTDNIHKRYPTALLHIDKAREHEPNNFKHYLDKAIYLACHDDSPQSLEAAAKLWQHGFDLAVKADQVKEIAGEYYAAAAAIELVRGNRQRAGFLLDIGKTHQSENEVLQKLIAKYNGIKQVEGKKN